MSAVKMSSLMKYAIVAIAAALLGVMTVYAPTYVVGAIVAVAVGWLGFTRPGLAVALLLAWLPLEGFVLKFVGVLSPAIVLSEFLGFVLVVWVVSRLASDRSEPLAGKPIVLVPVLVLLIAAGLSWAVSTPPTIDALYWLRVNLRYVPIAVACLYVSFSDDLRSRFVPVVIFTALTQGVVGAVQFVGGPAVAQFFWPGQFSLGGVASQGDTFLSVGGRSVAGTVGHYNIFGLLMVVCFGILLASSLSDASQGHRRYSRIREVALALAALMTVMSQSRQAIAIGVILIPLVFVSSALQTRPMFGRRVAMVVAIASAAVLGALSVASELTGRVLWVLSGNYVQYEAAANRGYVMTVVTRSVFTESPLLGVGPGSFGSSYSSDLGPIGVRRLGLDVVSSRYVGDVGWVSLFAQVGIVGLGAVLSTVVLALRVFFDRLRSVEDRCLAYLFAAVVGLGMLASTPLAYKSVSSLIWVIYGIVLVARPEVKDRQSS